MPNPISPLPSQPAAAASTALEAELIGRIRGHGPLTFGGYMARCLYDPYFGYYTGGRNFKGSGPGRDFLTAATLTPLFGATLAGWVAAQWRRLGRPGSFTLLEAGPGNGALMHSLWHALPDEVRAAARIHLVESSPALTHIQQQALAGLPVTWSANLAPLCASSAPNCGTVAPDSRQFATVCITNELLDAFPAELYKLEKDVWHQRIVTLSDAGALTLGWRPSRKPPTLPAGWEPADGALLETSESRQTWLRQLSDLMKKTGGASSGY